MPKRFRSTLAVVVLGLAMCALLGARVLPDGRTSAAALVNPGDPLPQTRLDLPGVAPGTTVVAATLADIDADGDLDLVASDGTLDLLVWKNDGNGFFTREYPSRSPRGGSLSDTGSLDSSRGGAPASLGSVSGASALAAGRSRGNAARVTWRPIASTVLLPSRALLTRGSRAPPAILPSA